jgi:small subunit ribosomal protein S23
VVQRQLHLLEQQRTSAASNDSISDEDQLATELAYDQARKEFYKIRLRQDIEREVAKEEAIHYGSHFIADKNERALHIEDEAYENWKTWAMEKTEVTRVQLATAFSESGFVDESEDAVVEAEALPEPAAGEELISEENGV